MNGVLNHLWQSTLFAAGIYAICLVLRRNSARTRYWLWLAASLKFLIPFAALIALGTRVETPRAEPLAPAMTVAQVSASFSPMTEFTPVTTPAAQPQWPYVIAAIWLAGSLILLVRWHARWRTVRTIAKSGQELPLSLPLPVLLSSDAMEPGIFGVLRPVLLLPRGIWDRLTPEQLEAVLAHELSHHRYRDNLTAALHMCVEVVFWLHPLTWWIGKKLVDERERACDEAVLASGREPADYAQGIVSVCRYFVSSPMACAAGISGADLRKRIFEIMTHGVPSRLTAYHKCALAGFFLIAVSTPIVIGALRAQSGVEYRFEVASIRPAAPGYGNRTSIHTSDSRLTTRNTSIFSLITFAYGVQPYQVTGGPDWVRDDRYDIAAKYDPAEDRTSPASDQEGQETRRQRMEARVRNLLAERFQLELRTDVKQLPVYALVQDGEGHKLKAAPEGGGNMNTNQSNGTGVLHGEGVPVKRLTTALSHILGRPVIDETGLTDLYSMELKWSDKPEADAGPTIFTALREQLGLKLESRKGPVTHYVIERVEKPSEN